MEKISPSEIRKYIYCPYQWYYERHYGIKHLRELYKKRNEALGFTDASKSHFIKGAKFHDKYRPFSIRVLLVKIFILLAVIGGIYLVAQMIS